MHVRLTLASTENNYIISVDIKLALLEISRHVYRSFFFSTYFWPSCPFIHLLFQLPDATALIFSYIFHVLENVREAWNHLPNFRWIFSFSSGWPQIFIFILSSGASKRDKFSMLKTWCTSRPAFLGWSRKAEKSMKWHVEENAICGESSSC